MTACPLELLLSTNQEITSVRMRRKKTLYVNDGNINWCSLYGKQYNDSLKILKIEPACYPAVPLLGIYLKNMKTLI